MTENKHIPRFVLIGETGSGKSAFGNFILKNDVFESKGTVASVTPRLESKIGNWLGAGDQIEIVDCPGFNDPEMDVDAVEDLIKEIRKLQSVNIFILIFNSQQTRMTLSQKTILNIFRGSFGIDFFTNSVLIFTHWAYDVTSPEVCRAMGLDKAARKAEMNAYLRKEYSMHNDLPVYFVNSLCPSGKEQSEADMTTMWSDIQDILLKPLKIVDVAGIKKMIQDYESRAKSIMDLIKTTDKDFESLKAAAIDTGDLMEQCQNIQKELSKIDSKLPQKPIPMKFRECPEIQNIIESINAQERQAEYSVKWATIVKKAANIITKIFTFGPLTALFPKHFPEPVTFMAFRRIKKILSKKS